MILPPQQDHQDVMLKNQKLTKKVIEELISEVNKTDKSRDERTYFEDDYKVRQKFVFSTHKLAEKLTSTEWYIVAFKAVDSTEVEVFQVFELPSDLKSLVTKKSQNKQVNITHLSLKSYEPGQRDVLLERQRILERFNAFFYDFIADEFTQANSEQVQLSLKNAKVLTHYKELVNSTDFSVFLQDENLKSFLKFYLRKEDKARFQTILDFVYETIHLNSPVQDAEQRLLAIRNGFLKKTLPQTAKKTKYLSSKDASRNQREELEKRLVHTNYYYAQSYDLPKLKLEGVKALLELYMTLPEEELLQTLEDIYMKRYKLGVLLSSLHQPDLKKQGLEQVIVTIKAHYKQHVHSEDPLSELERFVLAETHKYIKGRYRKLKEAPPQDLNKLFSYAFNEQRIKEKILNHLRNLVRTYCFYEGRHQLHFESKDATKPYDSDALQSLNRIETLFKSMNSLTSLVQLTFMQRMNMIDKHVSLDFIGGARKNYEFITSSSLLNQKNLHLWYDLTKHHDDIEKAKTYLKDTVNLLRQFRMNVAHYKYDIEELFAPVSKEHPLEIFDYNEEIKGLQNLHALAFLRTLHHNGLHQLALDKSLQKALKQYYETSLEPALTYLPRPHKVLKELLKESEPLKTLSAQELQARTHLFKTLYYGPFKENFKASFSKYRDAYNASFEKDKGFHSKIYGANLKEAHEWLQSMVSRNEITYQKWLNFIKFSFQRFRKENDYPLFEVSFNQDTTHSWFASFALDILNQKSPMVIRKLNNQSALSPIIAASKFLQKRDVSRLKHHLEKYQSSYPHELIEASIVLLKLLLSTDFMDPITHYVVQYKQLDEEQVMALILRKYDVLDQARLHVLNDLKKQSYDWILKHVNQFSDEEAYVVILDANKEEKEVPIYKQGQADESGALVAHGHLTDVYRSGFLPMLANYLKESSVKANLNKSLDEYSDLSYELSHNPQAYSSATDALHQALKSYKKDGKKIPQTVLESGKKAFESMRRYAFLKHYFEGAYLVDLTSIITDLFSRMSARYYQLERDYAYTCLATKQVTKSKILMRSKLSVRNPHAQKIGFNMYLNENRKWCVSTEIRNDFLHGNIFQSRAKFNQKSRSYQSLLELFEQSYEDFNYHTALRNNHNEIIPFILNDYYIEAQYQHHNKHYQCNLKNLTYGLKDESLKQLSLDKLTLREGEHLDLIYNVLNISLEKLLTF